MNNNAAAGR